MVDVVFIKNTVKRRIGERVSFDEESAARIVARGDAEYAGGTRPFEGREASIAGWGVKPDPTGE